MYIYTELIKIMANPDLVAEKFLHSNPDQGFGEAYVLPYIQRGFDDTFYKHLGAANERAAQERATAQKRADDYYAKFKTSSNESRGNTQHQFDQADLQAELGRYVDAGQVPRQDYLANRVGQLEANNAQDKLILQQHKANVDEVIPKYKQTYGDAYNNGLAVNQANAHYYGGERFDPYNHEADPLKNTSLYDLETGARQFAGKFDSIGNSKTTNGTSYEDPEHSSTLKTSTGAVFMTKDPKTGQMIPNVGDQHVKAFLDIDNGINKVKIEKEFTDPAFYKDAEELQKLGKTEIAYAKYGTMTIPEILNDIKGGNPLKNGDNYARYTYNVAKNRLETYNNIEKERQITNEVKSNIDSSTGGDTDTNVVAIPTNYTHEIPTGNSTYTSKIVDGKQVTVANTHHLIKGTIPGVSFYVKPSATQPGKPGLPVLNANVPNLRNLTTGQIVQHGVTDPTIQITHAGFGLIDPSSGRMVSGDPTILAKRLSELATQWKAYHASGDKGTPPQTYGKFVGNDIASGYSNERVNVENDEAAKKIAEDTGGQFIFSEDDSGKKIATIRYAVQAPFKSNDIIGSHIQASTNYYNRTQISPDEAMLRQAWSDYAKAIEGY